MKNIRYIVAAFLVYVAQFASAEVQVLSDNEVKDEILYYIAPRCGVRGKRTQLVDTYFINGNTNRLLRLLSDLIKTNDEWSGIVDYDGWTISARKNGVGRASEKMLDGTVKYNIPEE